VEWKQISRPSTRAPESEIRARRLGIIHYARKPIDLRQLAVLARRMIAKSLSSTGFMKTESNNDE